MATRIAQKPQNRQNNNSGYSANSGGVDVGLSAVTQMARDDTRWFVVGIVVLALVILLALPITVLIVIDDLKLKAEIRQEMRQLKKLEKDLNEKNHSVKSLDVDGLS